MNELLSIVLSCDAIYMLVTIQMKATEHYFPVVLFIMLYKVVRTFDEDETLKCEH